MVKVEEIIKVANNLGWEVKVFKSDDKYIYEKPLYEISKPMKSNEVSLRTGVNADCSEELVGELVKNYTYYDYKMEALCWQDGEGLPEKETGYESKSELENAVKLFKKDLRKLIDRLLDLYI